MNYISSLPRLLLLFAIGSVISLAACGQDATGEQQESGYYNIDVAEFDKLSEKSEQVTIDVRTPEEIAEGKVEGAVELDFYSATFYNELMAMDKSKPYLIYCRSGGRSSETADSMAKAGFEHVYNLEGGYTAWSEEHAENE